MTTIVTDPLLALCPECGHVHEDTQAMGYANSLRGIRPPRTGDLTLCNRCGAFLIFTTDNLADRVATPAEFEGYSKQQRALFLGMQRRIRERYRRRH
jgi:hypothetical protein